MCLRRCDSHGQAMTQAKAVATSPPAGDSMVRRTAERIGLFIASPFLDGKPHNSRFADGERFHQDQWSRYVWSLVLGLIEPADGAGLLWARATYSG